MKIVSRAELDHYKIRGFKQSNDVTIQKNGRSVTCETYRKRYSGCCVHFLNFIDAYWKLITTLGFSLCAPRNRKQWSMVLTGRKVIAAEKAQAKNGAHSVGFGQVIDASLVKNFVDYLEYAHVNTRPAIKDVQLVEGLDRESIRNLDTFLTGLKKDLLDLRQLSHQQLMDKMDAYALDTLNHNRLDFSLAQRRDFYDIYRTPNNYLWLRIKTSGSDSLSFCTNKAVIELPEPLFTSILEGFLMKEKILDKDELNQKLASGIFSGGLNLRIGLRTND